MKIKIETINKNPLFDIREAGLITQNKECAKDSIMSMNLLHKYLISEHSPIRAMKLKIILYDISYNESVHIVRHWVGIDHYVKSNRPDIAKKERSVNDTVNHQIICSPASLINIAQQRLCFTTSKGTREIILSLKNQLESHKDESYNEISKMLVPKCVYRSGCPEFKNCGFFAKYKKDMILNIDDSLTMRYYKYSFMLNH